jgi:hypothetical protein
VTGKPLDWIRAGALTAAVATLVVIWLTGLSGLGYFGWPSQVDWTFAAGILISVAAGATLGHRQPGPLLRRALLALAVGAVFAGALFGLLFLLWNAGLHPRHFTTIFLVLAAALAAWGLRRLPTARGARVTLLTTVALLAAVRLLASFPLVVRRLERRLFPLPVTVTRAHWDQLRCGSRCDDGRSRLLTWRRDDVSYEANDYDLLTADARMTATLEVVKPFFVDGCDQAHDSAPRVPASFPTYASTRACELARPRPWPGRPAIDPDCCAVESHAHLPGERFESKRTTRFIFTRLRWEALVEEPTADTPRPYVIIE